MFIDCPQYACFVRKQESRPIDRLAPPTKPLIQHQRAFLAVTTA
jgi:hypothetical protein